MTEAIKDYLPWLLSAITIWMTLLAGNKHPKAWLVGLGNQLLWLIFIVSAGMWGLLPMNIALWIVYRRNHLKWTRDLPANNTRQVQCSLLHIEQKTTSRNVSDLARPPHDLEAGSRAVLW